jgi:hypothetical protein
MSQQIDDGGSAFPVHSNHVVFGDKVVAAHEPGMSLRAWLAGQALAGLINRYDEHPNNLAQCAELACNAADAVIAELNRRD